MTTREPGASEVLTHGGTVRPFSTAFLARMPAAIITEGLDVLVQLVMAAMTMEPLSRYLSTSTLKRSLMEVVGPASCTPFEASGVSEGWPPSPSQRMT